MRKDFYKVLNIEKEETISVFLFLVQSIFLGIFYGAFDVGAHALFLSVYPASMIPKAYVISGIAGIILTSLYARIQNRLPFSTLAIINLIFISISTAVLRLLFQFTESSWLIFLIFVMMGPLNILALLGFWGGVGRIFTLRQGKRLFGLVDTGQIFGAILSAFAIPVLITFGFQQKNLLLLSSVSIIGALVFQIIISIKFNLNKQVKTSGEKQKRLPELLKNKYILYMAIFVVMSMLAAFFVQYSFLSVTKENYPDHNDLTKFLGAFTGSLLLFTFLFKTFVYSKVMKTYGLKFSIIVSPFLIGLFTIAAALIGSIWGYTTAAASFVFFFLVISLSRLFSKALKDSVEGPSFKILYQSLKSEIRHDVQAYVDGTINEIAALSAGLLLAALSLFKFFTLIHFSYSLIIILIIWFFAARKLYIEYKVSLQKSLAEYKGHKDDVEHISDLIYNKLDSVHSKNPKLVPGLEIDCELHPQKFEDNVSKLIKHENSLVKNFALNKIIESKLVESISVLEDNEIKSELINETLNKIIHEAKVIDKSPGVEQIINLAKSKSTDERVWAGYLISKFYQKDYFVYLKALIRDLHIAVKISGIKSATKLELTDLCPLIIEYLDTLGVYTHAYEALLAFGEKSLNYLDQVFYKTGTNHRILIRIVKLYGQIGGEKAKELLVKKLDHPNEEILYYVLLSLKQCDFKADESNINHIQHITEQHIGIMGWNIAAKLSLSETVLFEYLKDAVNEELEANYNYLYLLLSLAYDAKSIIHVKENIESGTSEGVSYALELLDLFISDELKPKLFPIVEDISLIEKIRQLQNFYPIEKLSIDNLLIDIINRDINHTNIWTKACAIKAFNKMEGAGITNDLIAHLFNPIDLLRQTASVVIHEMDKDSLSTIRKRLDDIQGEELDSTIDMLDQSKNHLFIERTLFLKSIEYFKNVSGRYLYHLAMNMSELNSETLDLSNLVVSDLLDKILLVKGDPVKLSVEDENDIELIEGELYVMNELVEYKKRNLSFSYNDNSAVFYIEKNSLIYNMFDFYEIETSVFKWFNKQLETESFEQ